MHKKWFSSSFKWKKKSALGYERFLKEYTQAIQKKKEKPVIEGTKNRKTKNKKYQTAQLQETKQIWFSSYIQRCNRRVLELNFIKILIEKQPMQKIWNSWMKKQTSYHPRLTVVQLLSLFFNKRNNFHWKQMKEYMRVVQKSKAQTKRS